MKNAILRKTLCVLFTAALLIGTAACAARGSATPAPAAPAASGDSATDKEYYELVFLREQDTSEGDPYHDQQYVRAYLKENFNIGYQDVHYAGDLQERLMLLLAGGDYPDVINPKQTALLHAYADAGALVNMGELFEKYAPNVLERHKDRIPVWKAISGMNDGNVWVMTIWQPDQSGARANPMNEWLFRSDILEQQGYPDIYDENSVYDVIKKGLEDNPTTNGKATVAFSQPLNSWGVNGLQCATYTYNMGRLHHMTFNRGMIYDYDADQFIDVAKDHSYRNGLEFYNKMFRDGLYDKDAITETWDDFDAKMREGRPLSAYFYVWGWTSWNFDLAMAGAPYRYVPIPSMLSSQREHGEKKVYTQNSGEVWSSVCITKNAKYPERIAEVMNWQASDEGMVLMGWGREGVEYTIENGKRVATQYYLDNRNEDDYRFLHGGPSEFGFYLGVDSNGQSYSISSDSDVVALTTDPIVLDVWSHYGWSNTYDMYYKNKNFTMDDTEQVDLKNGVPTLTDDQHKNWERIDAATHDFTMQLITAESPEAFDKIFDDLHKRRAELGHGEILEIWNKEYKELREFYGIK